MITINQNSIKFPNLTDFPSTPQEGVWVRVNGKFYVYDGSKWVELG